MSQLFDTFNRLNADQEYQLSEEEQNYGITKYNTYYGYAESRDQQQQIESIAEQTKNLRPKYGYGQTDGLRVGNFSSLRNGVILTNFGEPQQLASKISGPAFIYRVQQGTEAASKLLQSEQTVARKQTHGLVGVSTLDNVLTPQIPCIKKIQPHEAVQTHPRLQIRSTTYLDTRMMHRSS